MPKQMRSRYGKTSRPVRRVPDRERLFRGLEKGADELAYSLTRFRRRKIRDDRSAPAGYAAFSSYKNELISSGLNTSKMTSMSSGQINRWARDKSSYDDFKEQTDFRGTADDYKRIIEYDDKNPTTYNHEAMRTDFIKRASENVPAGSMVRVWNPSTKKYDYDYPGLDVPNRSGFINLLSKQFEDGGVTEDVESKAADIARGRDKDEMAAVVRAANFNRAKAFFSLDTISSTGANGATDTNARFGVEEKHRVLGALARGGRLDQDQVNKLSAFIDDEESRRLTQSNQRINYNDDRANAALANRAWDADRGTVSASITQKRIVNDARAHRLAESAMGGDVRALEELQQMGRDPRMPGELADRYTNAARQVHDDIVGTLYPATPEDRAVGIRHGAKTGYSQQFAVEAYSRAAKSYDAQRKPGTPAWRDIPREEKEAYVTGRAEQIGLDSIVTPGEYSGVFESPAELAEYLMGNEDERKRVARPKVRQVLRSIQVGRPLSEYPDRQREAINSLIKAGLLDPDLLGESATDKTSFMDKVWRRGE